MNSTDISMFDGFRLLSILIPIFRRGGISKLHPTYGTEIVYGLLMSNLTLVMKVKNCCIVFSDLQLVKNYYKYNLFFLAIEEATSSSLYTDGCYVLITPTTGVNPLFFMKHDFVF